MDGYLRAHKDLVVDKLKTESEYSNLSIKNINFDKYHNVAPAQSLKIKKDFPANWPRSFVSIVCDSGILLHSKSGYLFQKYRVALAKWNKWGL